MRNFSFKTQVWETSFTEWHKHLSKKLEKTYHHIEADIFIWFQSSSYMQVLTL